MRKKKADVHRHGKHPKKPKRYIDDASVRKLNRLRGEGSPIAPGTYEMTVNPRIEDGKLVADMAVVDDGTNEEMLGIIRRIVDDAGFTGTPFLDDAVQAMADESKALLKGVNRLGEKCHNHGRCRRCIGPLGTTDLECGYSVCGVCFADDYKDFVNTHRQRLSQLPEPKPEVRTR